MPTNLTGSTIASTYDQLLHIDGGPTASEKVAYSGTGVATALKIGTTSAGVGNLSLAGNTLSSTNTNGNITLSPNGTGSVAIGKVAITGGTISGITDLAIADGGTGASTAANARTNLGLGSMATQDSNNVSIIGGAISGVTFSGVFSGITAIDSTTFTTSNTTTGLTLTNNTLSADGTDTNIDINITPKGAGRTVVGALSVTSPRILSGINDINANEILEFSAQSSAVNNLTIANATTTNPPTLFAAGSDTNIDLRLYPKGTGAVISTGKLGYATGTGGTVTQATSKSTGVTLNKVCGQITMNNATLNRVTSVTFTLTNSFIAATDVVVVNIASGATAGAYTITVEVVAAGSCNISLHNLLTGTDLSEAVVLNFAVIKAVNS